MAFKYGVVDVVPVPHVKAGVIILMRWASEQPFIPDLLSLGVDLKCNLFCFHDIISLYS